MSHYNIVRFRVKPGMDRAFLEAHRPGTVNWPGLHQGIIVNTGEGTYCLIGEWQDEKAMKAAMPQMQAKLDTFRHVLIGGETGVTDAVSGPAVLALA
jgi:quinol monooxygenase YgiN